MLFLVFTYFFVSKAPLSSAHPLVDPRGSPKNTTDAANITSGWVSTPNVRGTANILISSLTTLALCAWTAYHPNVHPKRSIWHTSIRRLKWMLAAIFIPEWVLYCAWSQRYTAETLKITLNKILADKAAAASVDEGADAEIAPGVTTAPAQKPAPKQTVEKWTTEAAFFATSGGFAVHSSTFWPTPILTFTPDGLLALAKLNLLPVPAVTMMDKSKADTGTKILVCLQAGWFLLQTLARLVQHLPVTLLEIHVLAHVGCAFGMYWFWLRKPYDAEYPIILEDERIRDLVALWVVTVDKDESVDIGLIRRKQSDFIYFQSRRTRWAYSVKRALDDYKSTPEIPGARWTDDGWFKKTFPQLATPPIQARMEQQLLRMKRALASLDNSVETTASSDDARDVPSTPPSPAPPPSTPPQPDVSTTPPSPTPSPTRSPTPSPTPSPNPSSNPSPNPSPPPSPYRPPHSIRRSNVHTISLSNDIDDLFVVPRRTNHVIQGTATLFTSSRDELINRSSSYLAAAVMGACYGAVHLAAWNAHFATPVEKWMWRASGLAFAAFPAATTMGLLWNLGTRPTTIWSWPGVTWVFDALWVSFMTMDTFVLLPAYMGGRVFVVGECFAGLRSAVDGTYRTVGWTGFVPHAGGG
ncbi:uncharacterized protein BDZ99DRAFT_573876 [Mytilinidion resinicola]|uniref:Uncharacterized protein n=1 Tax=Mytilinidion resinicola TaxID=574789 RepID=A0A6A6YCI0_9PEZI|nr:uncharacterized protein BDZ99DRAFT_573876 [Mytilinidion resinicola]KAF2806309.1 hypothetical protein BDZ99DRAFT_573876 [Mytilinidion resinicola]